MAQSFLISKERDGHVTVTKVNNQEPSKDSVYSSYPSKEKEMWLKTGSSNIDFGRREKEAICKKLVLQRCSAEDQTTDNTALCHLLPTTVYLWLNL